MVTFEPKNARRGLPQHARQMQQSEGCRRQVRSLLKQVSHHLFAVVDVSEGHLRLVFGRLLGTGIRHRDLSVTLGQDG
jgi:hypothetical protein